MFKKNYIPKHHCNLYFTEPVECWDEAIPIGNGLLGCLVWGNGYPLRFSIDRGDLWDKRVASEILAKDYTYKELIKLVNKKQWTELEDRFDVFYTRPAPTKIPAGKLELDFGKPCGIMESGLILADASCEIRIGFSDSSCSVYTFMHAERSLGFIRVEGDGIIPAVVLRAPEYSGNSGICFMNDDGTAAVSSRGGLGALGYPEEEYGSSEGTKWFRQKTSTGLEYAMIVAVRKTGDMSFESVYTVASNMDGEDWFDEACKRLEEALRTGFSDLFEEHRTWWQQYWEKSSLSICDKEFEKNWYIANYLFGSCSRKGFPPMPLQGVWTADDGGLPPWKGDYHNDLNTQMSYWHYMKANHMEEGESFADFLWNLVPEAREFARTFFDSQGLCLPSVMSLDGKPLGGWPMYCMNLTNQIWLCQAFDNHWQYSGDLNFMKEKAYPYLKETAECILRWLKQGSDGKLYLPLSSSPEIHDNLPESWITPNSNYDLALLIYLFRTLNDMAEVLDNSEAGKWLEKLRLLPELSVNADDILMISPDECLKESHRHFSHAMAIYPLKLLKYENEKHKRVIDATVQNLEQLGTGFWVGFSFPWMAEFYAIQGNGEGAAYQLKLFWENFCSQNSFNLNGDYKKRGLSSFHYRPFTLEANIAAADALHNMLMKDEGGVIRVFPAIPQEWYEMGASFRNLRGRKGILVSSCVSGEKVGYIELKAAYQGKYSIKCPFESEYITIERVGITNLLQCRRSCIFEVELSAGESLRIIPGNNIL